MINFFKQLKRKKILSSVGKEKRGRFLSIEQISSVGVAYSADSPQSVAEIEGILGILKSEGISYDILIFEKKKGHFIKFGITQFAENPNITLLYKDKIDFAGVPFGEEYENMMGKKYDLFIFCNSQHDFAIDYTAAYTKSDFTTGMYDGGYPFYTLLVSGNNKQPLSPTEYIKQVFHYLKTIKTND